LGEEYPERRIPTAQTRAARFSDTAACRFDGATARDGIDTSGSAAGVASGTGR